MRIDHFSVHWLAHYNHIFRSRSDIIFPFFLTYQPASSTIAVLGLCLCRFAFHLFITKLLINRCSTNAVGFSSLVSNLFFINCNFHFAFNQLNHQIIKKTLNFFSNSYTKTEIFNSHLQ